MAASTLALAAAMGLALSRCAPGEAEDPERVQGEWVAAVEELRALRAEIQALKRRSDELPRTSGGAAEPAASASPDVPAPRAGTAPAVTPVEPPTVSVGPALGPYL